VLMSISTFFPQTRFWQPKQKALVNSKMEKHTEYKKLDLRGV